jgi:SAM-dependent methyltransferase
MKECSKSVVRRLSDSNFLNRYFVGNGVDIGGKPDPLLLYKELFKGIRELKTWDWEDGDAQFMSGVDAETFDFVHSSHCLEHLQSPEEGLKNWLRIVKPGGHLIITVPDEDLYEQGVFPSTFNRDHKWTFTMYKGESWSSKSVNVLTLVQGLGPGAELVRAEQISATYRYDLPRFDQTLSPVAECAIEFIVRKRPTAEIADRGRWRRPVEQPQREVRLHLNQYRDDMKAMKTGNGSKPPFLNDEPIG